MKKITICILTSLILIIFVGCKKKKDCEEPSFITNSSLNVSFIEKSSGKYLFSEVSPIYNLDSLKIVNSNGIGLMLLKSLNTIPNTSSRYSVVNFGPLFYDNLDQESFTNEICRKFYIKYRYNETDTLNVCYKSANQVCGSVFSTLKVYYKNQLILDKTNLTGSDLTILK